jgi:adenylyl cyclase CyaB, putative
MQLEVEQKFAIADRAATEQTLLAAGVVWGEVLAQADAYWNHPARDFSQTDEALRLRQVGERNFITYKGPRLDTTTKTRRELEVALPAGAEFREQFGAILSALGFRPVATVRKQRRPGILTWQNQEVQIALDDVQDVGVFVELEIVCNEPELDRAKNVIQSLAARLGLTQNERRSYLELLLQKSPK